MRPHANAEEDRLAEVTPALRPAAPWRVAHLEVLPGFRLHARFNDGTEGTVELCRFSQFGIGRHLCSAAGREPVPTGSDHVRRSYLAR